MGEMTGKHMKMCTSKIKIWMFNKNLFSKLKRMIV